MLAAGAAALARPLVERLASHGMASCSQALVGGLALGRAFSAAAAEVNTPASTPAHTFKLTPEQKQRLPALLALIQKPGGTAARLGTLTGATAAYRDLSVVMGALHLRQLEFVHPVLVTDEEYAKKLQETATEQPQETAAAAGSSGSADAQEQGPALLPPSAGELGTFLPMVDASRFEDGVTVSGTPAPEDLKLEQKYMDKISCWMQLLPNHVEMSYPLLTGINLFPPQEATYPTYVDFDAAMRLMSHRKSRKRMKLGRKLMRKQDRYQIKSWDHHPGEA